MLSVHNLTVAYGKKTVFDGVSFSAEAGDRIHLNGASGAGKTTLLNAIAGLTKATGTVEISGKVAYMFQEPRLIPWLSVLANLQFVLPKGADPALAEKYLSAVELWEDRDKLPAELSGGMSRRVALARALAYAEATEAALILLDEPLTGVDEACKLRLYPVILQAAEGKMLILSTHDEREAQALTTSALTVGA